MQELTEIFSSLPGWAIAAIIVVVGWPAAGLARFIMSNMMRLMHFNQFCDRTGVCDFLRKGEVPHSPSDMVGIGVYWVILVAVFLEAARILDIGAADQFRHRVIAALPGVLSGILVLAVGLILVAFLAGFVRTLTRNAGSLYANLWSRTTRWLGIMLVLAVALEQTEIRGSILAGVIQIVIAAFAFGMALAFGLGCKDMARNAMERLISDLRDRHKARPRSDMEG